MRIAQIAPPWTPVPPPLYGGIELVVDLLSRGLQAAGHEVVLFTTGDSTCPVPKRWVLEEAEGTRIGMAVPELRHVVHAYEAVRDADVVHDHTVFGPLYAERFGDLPVVTTIHGPFNDELTDLYRIIAQRVPGDLRLPRPAADGAAHPHRPRDPPRRSTRTAFPVGDGRGGYCLFLGRMAPEKGPTAPSRRAARPACRCSWRPRCVSRGSGRTSTPRSHRCSARTSGTSARCPTTRSWPCSGRRWPWSIPSAGTSPSAW